MFQPKIKFFHQNRLAYLNGPENPDASARQEVQNESFELGKLNVSDILMDAKGMAEKVPNERSVEAAKTLADFKNALNNAGVERDESLRATATYNEARNFASGGGDGNRDEALLALLQNPVGRKQAKAHREAAASRETNLSNWILATPDEINEDVFEDPNILTYSDREILSALDEGIVRVLGNVPKNNSTLSNNIMRLSQALSQAELVAAARQEELNLINQKDPRRKAHNLRLKLVQKRIEAINYVLKAYDGNDFKFPAEPEIEDGNSIVTISTSDYEKAEAATSRVAAKAAKANSRILKAVERMLNA